MADLQKLIQKYLGLYGESNDPVEHKQEIQGDYVRNWIVAASHGRSDANEILKQVIVVWNERRKELPQFISAERPDWGIMRSLGYRVGIAGIEKRLTPEHRRALVDFAFHAEALPPIKDKTYMNEWGPPKSPFRYLKIKRFLESLIIEYEGIPSMDYAVDDWRSDLNFVESEIRSKALR